MSFVFIVLFLVAAALFIAMRTSPAIKESLASAWAALAALALAFGTWVASWWTNTPVDIPPL